MQYSEVILELQRAEEAANKQLKHRVFHLVKQLHPDCLETVLSRKKILVPFTGHKAPNLQFDLLDGSSSFMVRKNLTDENRQLCAVMKEMEEAFHKQRRSAPSALFVGSPVGDTIDDVMAPWRLQQTLLEHDDANQSRACVAAVYQSVARGATWGEAYADGLKAEALSKQVTQGPPLPSSAAAARR